MTLVVAAPSTNKEKLDTATRSASLPHADIYPEAERVINALISSARTGIRDLAMSHFADTFISEWLISFGENEPPVKLVRTWARNAVKAALKEGAWEDVDEYRETLTDGQDPAKLFGHTHDALRILHWLAHGTRLEQAGVPTADAQAWREDIASLTSPITAPPPGTRRATPADLKRLGIRTVSTHDVYVPYRLSSKVVQKTTYRARKYREYDRKRRNKSQTSWDDLIPVSLERLKRVR